MSGLEGDYRNWQPVMHSFFVDEDLRMSLYEKGYAVVPFASTRQLEELNELFIQYHRFKKEGGMFFGVFASDLNYRKEVHGRAFEILKPSFERYFRNYKDALSCFVVKAPGDKNEFVIHQDPSYVNEFQYSHLHVWCPLRNITMDMGPLCVIPCSHRFFYPYRSISIPAPFEKIKPLMRTYLKPLLPKAGEAIFLDPRTIHNSLPNTSDHLRVILLSQIFPVQAGLMTLFYDSKGGESRLEVFELPEDYFLRNTNFLVNVQERPQVGSFKGYIDFNFDQMGENEFRKLCEDHGVKPLNLLPEPASDNAQMIEKPY